jgi:hypothetical protein
MQVNGRPKHHLNIFRFRFFGNRNPETFNQDWVPGRAHTDPNGKGRRTSAAITAHPIGAITYF